MQGERRVGWLYVERLFDQYGTDKITYDESWPTGKWLVLS